MAVKDKFADEKLSDEQLDNVVGGTHTQCGELIDAIGEVSFMLDGGQKKSP